MADDASALAIAIALAVAEDRESRITFLKNHPVGLLTDRVGSLEAFAQWARNVELYARVGGIGTTTDDKTIRVAWMHMHADVITFFEKFAATVSTALMPDANASQQAAPPSFPPTSFSPLTWAVVKEKLAAKYVSPTSFSATMLELEHLPRGRGLTGTNEFLHRFRKLAEICGKPVDDARQGDELWRILRRRLTDREATALASAAPGFNGVPYSVGKLISLMEWLALEEYADHLDKRAGTIPASSGLGNNPGAGSSLIAGPMELGAVSAVVRCHRCEGKGHYANVCPTVEFAGPPSHNRGPSNRGQFRPPGRDGRRGRGDRRGGRPPPRPSWQAATTASYCDTNQE